jgi:hypothetical protein
MGFKGLNLMEMGIIQAQSWHTTPLDLLAVFEEIIPARNGVFEKRMPQLDIQDRSRDNPSKGG